MSNITTPQGFGGESSAQLQEMGAISVRPIKSGGGGLSSGINDEPEKLSAFHHL